MKNIVFIISLAIISFSCGSQQSAEVSENENLKEIFTPANFDEVASAYVGEEITVKGVIDHVCSHGGRKMFLVDMDAPGKVRINTNEGMAAFKSEWEGSVVIATGIVEEFIVDEAYLLEWEDELKAEELEDGEEHEDCEYEVYTESASYKQILRYREMMAEKGTDKLSFYSMIATEYQLLDD